ncbi:MAG TPA: AAA family ATPase, partial [Acidimicrobiia bacterium]|nr:AAA family ATPase [Acidimicrobiia bacterium]
MAAEPRLILLCGLPGSGKTTVARELARSHRALRFSPD